MSEMTIQAGKDSAVATKMFSQSSASCGTLLPAEFNIPSTSALPPCDLIALKTAAQPGLFTKRGNASNASIFSVVSASSRTLRIAKVASMGAPFELFALSHKSCVAAVRSC